MNADPMLHPKKKHRLQIAQKGGPMGAVARLSKYSERRGAVLDVGVNRGTMALHLCRLFCDMPIHLIEPIPAQCDYVRERFARFPTVEVHQMALSHETGQSDFHLADHVGSSSLFTNTGEEAAQHSGHSTAETITVETNRLDDWCAANAVDHIACMKLDTQGSEFNILTGAQDLLSRDAIDIIMLEWFAIPHYDGVPLLDEILTPDARAWLPALRPLPVAAAQERAVAVRRCGVHLRDVPQDPPARRKVPEPRPAFTDRKDGAYPMGRFVIVTPMKNEGPFILEWVAHNLAIGVDEMAIFSNDCTDGSDALLDRLHEMGKLRHVDNSSRKPAPQRRAYRRFLKMEIAGPEDWVIPIDADEYINVKTGDHTLRALTDAVPQARTLSMTWRLFRQCRGQILRGHVPYRSVPHGRSRHDPPPAAGLGAENHVSPRSVGAYRRAPAQTAHRRNLCRDAVVQWLGTADARPLHGGQLALGTGFARL